MQETQVQSLGWKDLLEKEMATHSSILAWKIPWMEEPDRLQSMGSQRVGHDWAISLYRWLVHTVHYVGLSWWLSSKESTCNAGDAGDLGSIPGSGRSPREENGNLLQCSCWENPMDRGAWRLTVHRLAESQTWLSDWAFMHVHYVCVIIIFIKMMIMVIICLLNFIAKISIKSLGWSCTHCYI